MTYQIRRSIHETSSSSANTLTMVSERGVRTPVKLDKPWICISGGYDTRGDGQPHEYLTRWEDKMAFLADDMPIWHKMFRKATGQDFIMYTMYGPSWDSKISESFARSLPGAIPVQYDEETGRASVPELGYMCGYLLSYMDWLIALPASTDIESLGLNYDDLEQCYIPMEALVSIRDLEKDFGEEYFGETLLEEIIFNPAIAVNIGGDAQDRDQCRGIVNGYLSDENKNSPLSYASYIYLDGTYRNGNETLILGVDGTKIRICRDPEPQPEYPDSIDMKITDCCYNDCPFCYENCTYEGKHGEIPDKLFSSIPEYTEIAIGGGNALLHPDIFELRKKYNVRMNLTLHAQDFLGVVWNRDELEGEHALLQFDAVGVSVSSVEMAEQLVEYIQSFHDYEVFPWDPSGAASLYSIPRDNWDKYSQIVIHAVNGVITEEMLKPLYDKDLRLLILGYKHKGRGVEFAENEDIKTNQKWLYDNINEVAKHFLVTAFDNLALEQLDIRRLMTDEEWKHFHMGDDGTHSMYIDLVKKEYGISSTDDRRWKLSDDLKEMFRHVRSVAAQDKAERS